MDHRHGSLIVVPSSDVMIFHLPFAPVWTAKSHLPSVFPWQQLSRMMFAYFQVSETFGNIFLPFQFGAVETRWTIWCRRDNGDPRGFLSVDL